MEGREEHRKWCRLRTYSFWKAICQFRWRYPCSVCPGEKDLEACGFKEVKAARGNEIVRVWRTRRKTWPHRNSGGTPEFRESERGHWRGKISKGTKKLPKKPEDQNVPRGAKRKRVSKIENGLQHWDFLARYLGSSPDSQNPPPFSATIRLLVLTCQIHQHLRVVHTASSAHSDSPPPPPSG